MSLRIDIIVDTVCPWCYVGKRRFERALEIRPQPDIQVGWRAFQLNPEMPREGMDRRTYVAEKFGGTERAHSVHASLVQAGEEEGISFDFKKIEKTPNTVYSHRLVRYAAKYGLQTPVISAIFDAYFLEGRDIGEPDTLARIADAAGMDHDDTLAFLESDTDTETILAEDELARRLGVNGVPCFIVNRKYAVSGAQSPEVLVQVFDLANQDDTPPLSD
ncbi:MAG TPA: DsbA family oxidoreductase [Rhodospirillaceae bacterium]|nr:DsbA family oxidoreductase [Rhodospirillaceae bacterium]|tara:strand:+ start:7658 stop:8311 length:654 start_codon:yes stop_codon:yes gene_type:complete